MVTSLKVKDSTQTLTPFSCSDECKALAHFTSSILTVSASGYAALVLCEQPTVEANCSTLTSLASLKEDFDMLLKTGVRCRLQAGLPRSQSLQHTVQDHVSCKLRIKHTEALRRRGELLEAADSLTTH